MLRFAGNFHHEYGVICSQRADEGRIKVKLVSKDDSETTPAGLRRRAFQCGRGLSWHGLEY
jgi:hypothetical protein